MKIGEERPQLSDIQDDSTVEKVTDTILHETTAVRLVYIEL